MSKLKEFEVTRKALFGRTCTEKVYLKSEADNAIAKLKAENERLKAENERLKDELDASNNQCENLINSATDIMLRQDKANDTKCAEIEKLTTDNRRLKRALWLARANGAKTNKRLFDILWKFAAREKVGVTGCCHKISYAKTLKEPKLFFQKFLEVERKCRAMADKFRG